MARRDSAAFRLHSLAYASALAAESDPPGNFLSQHPAAQEWARIWPGHAVFSSSGTTSNPADILLSPEALRHAAWRVNQLLDASRDDVALVALPVHHIAGFSQVSRAALAGSRVVWLEETWSAEAFLTRARETGATLSSLVPTQLRDLMVIQAAAPSSLREVLLGGAALSPELRLQALDLGWPLRETYGMTETASQVASAKSADLASSAEGTGEPPRYAILPGWEAETTANSLIRVRGPSLASGVIQRTAVGGWTLAPLADPDGWFQTKDRGMLTSATELQFLGRHDNLLKIRGIWTSADQVRTQVEAADSRFTVVARPDPRAGHELWLVTESPEETLTGGSAHDMIGRFQRFCPAHAPFAGLLVIPRLPKTALGKTRAAELDALLTEIQPMTFLR